MLASDNQGLKVVSVIHKYICMLNNFSLRNIKLVLVIDAFILAGHA